MTGTEDAVPHQPPRTHREASALSRDMGGGAQGERGRNARPVDGSKLARLSKGPTTAGVAADQRAIFAATSRRWLARRQTAEHSERRFVVKWRVTEPMGGSWDWPATQALSQAARMRTETLFIIAGPLQTPPASCSTLPARHPPSPCSCALRTLLALKSHLSAAASSTHADDSLPHCNLWWCCALDRIIQGCALHPRPA